MCSPSGILLSLLSLPQAYRYSLSWCREHEETIDGSPRHLPYFLAHPDKYCACGRLFVFLVFFIGGLLFPWLRARPDKK